MNYTRAEVLDLIRAAFNEGFSEGMREHSTSSGGKTWAESRTLRNFERPKRPSVAVSSTQERTP